MIMESATNDNINESNNNEQLHTKMNPIIRHHQQSLWTQILCNGSSKTAVCWRTYNSHI